MKTVIPDNGSNERVVTISNTSILKYYGVILKPSLSRTFIAYVSGDLGYILLSLHGATLVGKMPHYRREFLNEIIFDLEKDGHEVFEFDSAKELANWLI